MVDNTQKQTNKIPDELTLAKPSFAKRMRAARLLFLLALVTLILLPFHLISLVLRLPTRRWIPVLWHRAAARITSFKIKTVGKPASAPHGCLIAANHVSYLDIIALGACGPMSFVAKDEVRGWPILGHLARLQRCVFVTRTQRTKAAQQAAEIRGRLDQGDTLVLFAEGTTSDGNFIYPFKSSLFGSVGITGDSANMARIVQPVAIAYTHWHGQPMGRFDRPIASWPGDIALGPHLLRVLQEGVLDVVVMFGEPIAITPQTDRKDLTRQVEDEVRDLISRALRGRMVATLPPSKRGKSGLGSRP